MKKLPTREMQETMRRPPPAVHVSGPMWGVGRCEFCNHRIKQGRQGFQVNPNRAYYYEPYWVQEIEAKYKYSHREPKANLCIHCIKRLETGPKQLPLPFDLTHIMNALYPVLIPVEEQDMGIQAENRKKMERVARQTVNAFRQVFK